MITRIPLRGLLEVNCYLWMDEESRHGFLIDPGAQGAALSDWLDRQGITVEKILLTHGHFDHIGGVEALRKAKDIPVFIHQQGEAYLADPRLNLSGGWPPEIRIQDALTFRDGDILTLDANPDFSLKVIHTPGHTQDSCVFHDALGHAAFVGDTIFRDGSRGNDRFPGGNGDQLLRSIVDRILTLPDDTVLYSGHDDPTTVAHEKAFY